MDQRTIFLQYLWLIECNFAGCLSFLNSVLIKVSIWILVLWRWGYWCHIFVWWWNHILCVRALEDLLILWVLIKSIKLDAMVILFGVDTLLIGDSLNWAAFTNAFTLANVRDVLEHADHSLLICIVFCQDLVLSLLLVDAARLGGGDRRLHTLLLWSCQR
jgi:hypothetical protein